MFELAEQLKRVGRIADAEAAYRALSTNPDVSIRTEARFRLAMLLSSLNRQTEAAGLLRRILDEQPNAQRARLELAAILAKLGRVTDAQRELRAVQAGNLPPEAARLIDRFSAALRDRAPHGATIGVGLAPDTNINRGTQLDHLGTVFGDFLISKDAKQRSGIGMTTDAEAFIRRPLTGRINLLLKGAMAARLYRHSAANDVSIASSIGPEISVGTDRLTLAAAGSRRWYGGGRFSDSFGWEASYQHPLKRRALLHSTFSVYRVDNYRNDLEDGIHLLSSSGGEFAVNPRAGIGVSWTVIRRDLHDAAYSNWSAYPAIYAWRETGRVTLSGSITLGRLWADDRLSIYSSKRKDRYYRFSIGAVARHVTFRGFAPSLQLGLERNRSSVSIYDYHRRFAELGFSKAF